MAEQVWNVEEAFAMDQSLTLERIEELGLVAVVRGASREDALEVSAALIEGGIEGIEIAFTTPEAHRAIEDLDEHYGGHILLGAGTVTSPEQIEKSVAAGATFLVSPGCDPELVPIMKETGLAVMPGTLTPSEIMTAKRLGLEAVKLFPGSLGGSSYLKDLLGPFPEMSFLPTGGVSLENVKEWFEAGAFAVGVGGALVPHNITDNQEREKVVEQARLFASAACAAKS